MADSNGDYPTVIGPDAVIKGELKFQKGMRLLGQFEGEIESKGTLLIAEGARLSGDVKASSVRIEGTMFGNLQASDKVQLSASAKLEGDLQTARLEVADGATFIGRVAVGPQNGKPPSGASSSSSQASEKGRPAPQNQPATAGKR